MKVFFEIIDMLIEGSVLVASDRPGEKRMYAVWESFPDGQFQRFVKKPLALSIIDDGCVPASSIMRGGTTLTAYRWKE